MDLSTREYEVVADGKKLSVPATSLGHALRLLGDVHWEGYETITIRGLKPEE